VPNAPNLLLFEKDDGIIFHNYVRFKFKKCVLNSGQI
jgi:hypothetical protein